MLLQQLHNDDMQVSIRDLFNERIRLTISHLSLLIRLRSIPPRIRSLVILSISFPTLRLFRKRISRPDEFTLDLERISSLLE